jgi:hypothetical protein
LKPGTESLKNMKKILVSILALLLVSAGVYFFFFYSDRNYPDKLFPERTLVYAAFSGVDSIQKEGKQTLFWQKIETSPRKELYVRQLDQLISLGETAVGVDLRPLLSSFTREIAVGVIPAGGQQSGVLVAYVRRSGQAQEYLEINMDPALKRRVPDLKKSFGAYAGTRYYKYSSKTFPSTVTICYAILDRHLILTTSEAAMKILLDVRDKKAVSLRKSDAYRDCRKQVHYKKGIFFYVNGESALEFIRGRLPARAQFFWPAILQVSGVQAVHGFAYSIGFQDQGFREEGFVSVDHNRRGFAKAYMDQRPQKLAGLTFIPAESQAAGAATLPDGLAVWKEIDSQLQSSLSGKDFSQYRSMLQMLAALLDFDFQKDLFEPMGRQLSYGYELSASNTDLRDAGYFLALELRNPSHFREVVERLASIGQTRGITRSQEIYQGMHIDLLNMSAGGLDLNSAYTIDGSWFFFSTAQDFLKKAIDTMKSGKSITSLPDFQKVTTGFPDEVNGISYTNIQSTLRTYAAFMEKMAQQPDRRWMQDYGLTQEMRNLSSSLFGSGSFTLIEKDGIRYQSYSSVPKSLLFLPALFASQ